MMRALVVLAASIALLSAYRRSRSKAPAATAAPKAPLDTYPANAVVPVNATGGHKMDINAPPAMLGKAVFQKWCAPCHADMPGVAGTSALAERYKGTNTPAALQKRTNLNPGLIKHTVRNGLFSMPTFRKAEIDDKQLDALANYLSRK